MPKRRSTHELISCESPLVRINEQTFNWTYTQIARATGIDRSAIARLFERETLTPDFVTVWKLACLFDVPIEEVVDGAWFRDDDLLSPHGVQVLVESGLTPQEGWDDENQDVMFEVRRQFDQVIGRRRRQRKALGLPAPGRGRQARAD